jgi:hypothetical protein
MQMVGASQYTRVRDHAPVVMPSLSWAARHAGIRQDDQCAGVLQYMRKCAE